MGRAAHELDGLRTAADTALGALVERAAGTDRRGGRRRRSGGAQARGPCAAARRRRAGRSREHGLRGRSGSASSASRSTCRRCPAAPDEAHRVPADARAGRALPRRPGHRPRGGRVDRLWTGARWVTTDAASGAALGAELAGLAGPDGLLLLADGAACHGPKAPRAEDSRAGAYEEAVNARPGGRRPRRLARAGPRPGRRAVRDRPLLWPLLSAAAAGQAWTGAVLHHGAPYGVGWTVALWRRARRRG